ncbi:DUF6519 domain-containing protein [Collimonas sp. H4R21]|uniref:DUF6519 domain-containing protein n=1 Tax=Collimonas rhizosphaerae TaxID=3126357 RepID=A0ABU9PVQ1_9BURK
MKADLTRNTFHPLKHFSRVLMQQGRVQVDADWNEQTAILLHYLHTLGADLIGAHGGPIAHAGFALTPLTPGGAASGDFRITPGRYYVDGILCELDTDAVTLTVQSAASGQVVVQVPAWTLNGIPFQAGQYVEVFDAKIPAQTPPFPPTVVTIASVDPTHRLLTLQGAPAGLPAPQMPTLRRVVSYLTQPDYPVAAGAKLAAGDYQVCLDVWERHVSYVEDDSIREVALGGPDTATRSKVTWQVKLAPACVAASANAATGAGTAGSAGNAGQTSRCCSVDEISLHFQPPSRPQLKARAKLDAGATDPCIIAPDARYRGAENQLYRVEIHSGDTTPPTFKWSRENGSVVFPIVSGGGTNVLTLETLGRDDRFGLREGDWVEVENDDYVLQNLASPLLQVQAIDRVGLSVTLSGSTDSTINDGAKHPLLRRWDQQQGDATDGGLQLSANGAAAIVEDSTDNWLSLEDGVQIQFQKPGSNAAPNQYRTGDYWLIPARTATGNVEWPSEPDIQGQPVPLALPPDGIVHHYAPLGVLTVDAGGNVAAVSSDCRKQFDTVVNLTPKKP